MLVGLADLEQLDVAVAAAGLGALASESAAKIEPVHASLFGRGAAKPEASPARLHVEAKPAAARL